MPAALERECAGEFAQRWVVAADSFTGRLQSSQLLKGALALQILL
ncbi:hypothetical protein ACFIOY_19620 [Bradyrhizobium sp. TZ2]